MTEIISAMIHESIQSEMTINLHVARKKFEHKIIIRLGVMVIKIGAYYYQYDSLAISLYHSLPIR